MLRLFVGLALPDGVIARLTVMCAGLPGARWVEPQKMHITLRFIGEVDEGDAEEVDARLAGVVAGSFSLELGGLGTFGAGAKARALWAGVGTSQPLCHLQAKVESAVVRAGLPPEGRKFTPHITLARLTRPQPARLQAFIEANNLFQAGPFSVDQFSLFESRPGNGGPVYIPLSDHKLIITVPGTKNII
ncbi:MAG: RNA 2',3'-cyclic phosphodiesterase [Rhodospirillaceae bacterium]|nr:RNA 2',3'-cyclic phosphodiesterase [Rhodospirillaceae bacterium]